MVTVCCTFTPIYIFMLRRKPFMLRRKSCKISQNKYNNAKLKATQRYEKIRPLWKLGIVLLVLVKEQLIIPYVGAARFIYQP